MGVLRQPTVAQTAGAAAIAIYNDGTTPGRTGPVQGTMNKSQRIPVIGPTLTIAENIAKLGSGIKNKVRFASWGAEEVGLLGSGYYVAHLSAAQKAHIALNPNFDMLGSPNGRRGVYDGDDSEGAGTNPPAGSGAIEKVMLDYYGERGLRTSPSVFDGRSDYGPFIDNGIPAGGLDSGNDTILDQLSDGAAHAAQVFAASTLPVNGERVAARRAVTHQDTRRAPAGVAVR